MLRNRRVKAACEHCKTKIAPNRGCPQGGCLSPLLWSIVVDPLINLLQEHGMTITAYADDLAIGIYGMFPNELCTVMNEAMKIVENWCLETGLSVNPDKTQVMLFTNKQVSKLKLRDIKLYGTTLKICDDVKYLGIHLDTKLNMKKHIEYIQERANKAFWATRSMSSKTWGLTLPMLLYIFKQIILPRITYACVTFWHKLNADYRGSGANIKKLEKVQRTAALMISGAMRSTPNISLDVILGLTPIAVNITAKAIECYNRLVQNGTWFGDETAAGHAKIAKIAKNST